jgi:hypothetical protein
MHESPPFEFIPDEGDDGDDLPLPEFTPGPAVAPPSRRVERRAAARVHRR